MGKFGEWSVRDLDGSEATVSPEGERVRLRVYDRVVGEVAVIQLTAGQAAHLGHALLLAAEAAGERVLRWERGR